MKSLLFSILIFLTGHICYSQSWINGVSTSPNPANDCDSVTVTISGNLSSSNCTYVSSHVISANSITIDINVSCGGIGLPVITPYVETINIGAIPSNNYTLTVNQYSSFGLQETNITSLNIGSCCDAITAITNLNSSNCIGEATSFIDGGTIGDSIIWADNGVVFNPTPSALGWIYTFTNTGVHDIILTAIDSSGCSDSSNIQVTINDLPIISVSSSPATCSNCMDGEALVTVISGPIPHLFIWNIGGTSNPLTGLNPGNYSVTLTDGNTCSISDTVVVGNSIGIVEQHSELVVYPNPFKSTINIEVESAKIKVDVYDYTGKLLQSGNSPTIDLLDYSKGFYLLKVAHGDKIEEVRVVKQ
jgi:hypothetical protein